MATWQKRSRHDCRDGRPRACATSAGCLRRPEWAGRNGGNRGLGPDWSGRVTGFGTKSAKPAEPTATFATIASRARQADKFATSSRQVRGPVRASSRRQADQFASHGRIARPIYSIAANALASPESDHFRFAVAENTRFRISRTLRALKRSPLNTIWRTSFPPALSLSRYPLTSIHRISPPEFRITSMTG